MVDYDGKQWFRLLFVWHGSVLPRLLSRVFLCVTAGIVATYLYYKHGLKTPSIAHTLVGAALGLLLVFRTNASYDRYWEGRKIVGSIVNRSRDLMRQIATFLPPTQALHEKKELLRYSELYYRLLCQTLRSERDLTVIEHLLTPTERERLEPLRFRTPVVVSWISFHLVALVRAGHLTELNHNLMDLNLTALLDALGGCERILRTPVPFAYAQHIKVLVSAFCFTAPFVIVDAMKWGTPLASGIIAYALLGIDEIGVEIEEPFGYDPNDLPLDAIGEGIAHATREILQQSSE